MKFGLPPWAKRAKDAAREIGRALVKYTPPPAIDPTNEELHNGWTAEALAEYRAESDARAMAIVATSMDACLHGRHRPRWANSRYDPLRWRG